VNHVKTEALRWFLFSELVSVLVLGSVSVLLLDINLVQERIHLEERACVAHHGCFVFLSLIRQFCSAGYES
jgi:hypothetical protein